MYYENSIKKIREIIEHLAPGTKPVETELKNGEAAPFSHLLWMCDEIQKMDTASTDHAVRAGRWIGWVFAHLELCGGLTNSETRELSRKDRTIGCDKPNWLSLNGIQLPDWQGDDPRELIGLMTDKGEVANWISEYKCWSVGGYGQVPRRRQSQKPGKTKIVYPKLLIV